MALLIGSNLKDTLIGTGGDDTLNGLGGADLMRGGLGDDVYYVDQSADVPFEAFGQGLDTVRSSVNFKLGDNLEDLELTGSGNYEATGNALNNRITGNGGDNVLRGGAGNDTMDGSAGDDVVVYSGKLTDYNFGFSAGQLQLTDINLVGGNDGTDLISDVEKIVFSDITLNIDFQNLPEFKVNSHISSIQNASKAVGLADGGFVIVWQSNGQDGSSYGIYGQRYDADGVATSVEFPINTTTASLQTEPAITALADGGFIVTWTSPDADSTGIFGQRYAADGSTIGAEFQANTTTTSTQFTTGVAGLSDGGFVIIWQSSSQDGDEGGIYAQVYGANSVASGVEFRVNSTTAETQFNPEVTALTTGGFVVTWTSNDQDGDATGIFAQRYDADGNAAGGEFQVNTETAGQQLFPATGALADGGFVISWQSADADDYGIYAQRYDAEGVAVGGEFAVNTFTALDQLLPSVTGLVDGGFVIAWESKAQDSDTLSPGVYAQRYDEFGNALGGEFRVNTYLPSEQGAPHIASLDDGGFVITWTSFGQDGSLQGVYAQRYDGNGQAYHIELEGNAANNILSFTGGSAYMKGGLGNDTYTVDDLGDVVIENFKEGTDTVRSSVSYSLGAEIENLTLIGSANIDGSGNSLVNTITGNSGNNLIDGGTGADKLKGGAGNDTYIVDDAKDAITEAKNAGTDTVIATVSHTLAANVENLELIAGIGLKGTGNTLNNRITGSFGNDTLNGSSGNDTLNGAEGNDSLIGGKGNDEYILNEETKTLVEKANEGNDTIIFNPGTGVVVGAAFTLAANFENLSLIGADQQDMNANGNTAANSIIGNEGVNVLDGKAGNDTLIGGGDDDTLIGDAGNDSLEGGTGDDSMNGGAGNDTYVIEGDDTITDSAGIDTVKVGNTHTLGVDFENLELTGVDAINGTGNAANNIIKGNTNDNELRGEDGNDTISGGNGNDTLIGGNGIDSLAGGAEDDEYQVILIGSGSGPKKIVKLQDTVTEGSNAGNDSIVLSGVISDLTVATKLTLASTIENLDASATGDTKLNITGNAAVNHLIGNTAANIIDGGSNNDSLEGGDGNDSLIGGLGNDTLLGGNDNDTLNGGAGADSMTGGDGNDTYVVDNAGDVVDEGGGAGVDTVQSSINYSLGANVEKLTFTGTANLMGDGNAGNNILIGNDGGNLLSGLGGDDSLNGGKGGDLLDGGAGTDTLTGGLGNDSFFFGAPLGEVDTITDFNVVNDTIMLDKDIFAAFVGTGALAATSFVIGAGAAAADTDDHIIYDSSTGALYYDADGNGVDVAVQFAQLSTGLALTAADFNITA